MNSPPLWERYRDRLTAYTDAKANFDRSQVEAHQEQYGWKIDHYQIALPPEDPGPPSDDGSFNLACEIVERYEFPDPGILTGIYIPDQPLENRVMLLKARFLFFTFWMGVRVGEILNETRTIDGQPVKIWGYSYYTLEGHFEMGEMTFAVWKHLDTGAVSFHIDAFSKSGRINNWFYRLGFLIFGRWLQVQFARRAIARVRQLVIARQKK